MILAERHIINQNSIHFSECDRICLLSKNLYNYANYMVRQEFINSSKDKKDGLVERANYLSYQDIRRLIRIVSFLAT